MDIITFLLAIGLGLGTILHTAFWFVAGIVRRAVQLVPAYLLILVLATIGAVGLGLVLVPLFVIIKVITGAAWAVYVAAVTAVILTVLLAVLWTPLALFVGTVLNPFHPILAGQRYVRSIAVILFAELMFAIGLLVVPFRNNLGAMPFFLLAGAAFILSGLLWGGRLGPRFYRGVATVAFVLVTLSFFLPKTFQITGQKLGGVDQAIACGLGDCPSKESPLEEFTLQTDEEKLTILVGPGTHHRIWANKPFTVVARNANGTRTSYVQPSGWSSWDGGGSEGPLRVKGLADGTVIRFGKL